MQKSPNLAVIRNEMLHLFWSRSGGLRVRQKVFQLSVLQGHNLSHSDLGSSRIGNLLWIHSKWKNRVGFKTICIKWDWKLFSFIRYVTYVICDTLMEHWKHTSIVHWRDIHSVTNKFRVSNHIQVTSSAIYVFRPEFKICDIPLSGNTSFSSIGW